MTIDVSNVKTRSEWLDPDTGDHVVVVDGVETRTPPDPATAAEYTDRAKIRARLPAITAKAKAILADPAGATDWTALERKTILAAVVVDLAQRHR